MLIGSFTIISIFSLFETIYRFHFFWVYVEKVRNQEVSGYYGHFLQSVFMNTGLKVMVSYWTLLFYVQDLDLLVQSAQGSVAISNLCSRPIRIIKYITKIFTLAFQLHTIKTKFTLKYLQNKSLKIKAMWQYNFFL